MKRVLVLNSGSSSIKYQLIDLNRGVTAVSGLIERVGENIGARDGRLTQHLHFDDGKETDSREALDIPDHATGFRLMAEHLQDCGLLKDFHDLAAVGHRVVHGGERFSRAVQVDEAVLAGIRALVPLAPLHNPAAVTGLESARDLLPGVPQVAVFDTAFHSTLPARAYEYALPRDLRRRHHIRRYGFHGISCQYVSRRAALHLERPLDELNLIVLHLGNGASVTAIEGGRSIDTSMGMTPLEGLVMGSRSGDIDPAILTYLMAHADLSPKDVSRLLNRESGLKGLCGSNDMREVLRRREQGDAEAALALDVFAYRARKYIGAYTAALGRVDALVFTAGIGEHASPVREAILEGLSGLGYALDRARNAQATGEVSEIQRDDSRARVLVVATHEEMEIARQALACVEGGVTVALPER
ncbi:MAG: acetate kinase [Halothiobacillaceae bacterium]|jgi:acetate kinase|nr:acetate kinase [Halothiobacillaceae bacterium]MDY0049406.1 acetate kinase [Halothiobacillaceae bacterium]